MQDGNERNQHFSEMVEAMRSSMFRVARGMVRSDADAEDAVSAATITAYEHMSRLREPAALPGYLMRCTVNACHAILRRRKREIISEDLTSLSPAYHTETPMWMYVANLPEKFRLPILLRYSEGMSLEDTARILRIPKGTVSSRCSRGLDILKHQLTEEGSGYDK